MMEGVFRDVFVEGEVSNLREAASGHVYFDLKDREALLSAVMFKWDARKYAFELQEGVQVRVWGSLSCYAKQGRYQIVVKTVEALAKGNLFLEFEKLKKKLEAEGLFAPEHKKEIPDLSPAHRRGNFPHRRGRARYFIRLKTPQSAFGSNRGAGAGAGGRGRAANRAGDRRFKPF